jgi:hypothetical protein
MALGWELETHVEGQSSAAISDQTTFQPVPLDGG